VILLLLIANTDKVSAATQ